MKVTLINYTGMGMDQWEAANQLIFTKSTRLTMSPGLLDDIRAWSEKDKIEALEYMSNTIQSSLEFVDYTFLVEDCDRAFTHQLVRTRTGSYAQQTMRILNVSGFNYTTGPSIKNDPLTERIYERCMNSIQCEYDALIASGAEIEDARGVLPTNICTNIVAKFNLRTISELVAKRSSPRTQGAYRDYVNQVADAVLEVHPMFDVFLRNRKVDAAKNLDEFLKSCQQTDNISKETMTSLMKQVDILRGS